MDGWSFFYFVTLSCGEIIDSRDTSDIGCFLCAFCLRVQQWSAGSATGIIMATQVH
jgi:hypothetical protein